MIDPDQSEQSPSPAPPDRPLWLLRPILIIVVTVAAGFGLVSAATWLGSQVGAGLARDENVVENPGVNVTIEIPPGSSAGTIAQLLVENGVVASVGEFETAVRAASAENQLKAGTFDVVTGMPLDDLVALLSSGPGFEVFRITIVEGRRVTEIIEQLAEETGLPLGDFEEALLSGSVSTSLREMPEEPMIRDWEGLLFPDTYEVSERATAADILGRMASTMEQRVASIDWSMVEAEGFSVYDGITIASLIEAEVRVGDERPIVSSVIWNRLRDDEVLGIDATILYAMDTRDPAEIDVGFDSPYNTRIVAGVPPTPIAAPSLASLQASASPAETDFRYYVLSSPDGNHTFTRTVDEHNAAVAKAREDGVIP